MVQHGCSWSLGWVVHKMMPGPRFFPSCGSAPSSEALESSASNQRMRERTWRNSEGGLQGQGMEAAHITSVHILCLEFSHMATYNCNRGWEMWFNHVPKKKKEHVWWPASQSLPQWSCQGDFKFGQEALEVFTIPFLISLGRLSGGGEILGTTRKNGIHLVGDLLCAEHALLFLSPCLILTEMTWRQFYYPCGTNPDKCLATIYWRPTMC